ncbi:hypothetical protein BDY21DRAFT_371041 [Lineolata rhizophorae]|uniref:Azaphilone pigments biosynthesis cluster protein L N-terminal domain-containing protein n=1 Tax=Lineolata rhizophorae TaxID=578093 RepID=A0A6A6P2F3_9PEZI|nr:hypothetical protein BDY21DRAFT_371041 [Lineolata rhizophorae]
MAEALGITASVIAVAGLAYSSSQKLYQSLSDLHEAPETISGLKTDVGTLSDTIHSLKQKLNDEVSDDSLSDEQKANLTQIQPALKACCDACNQFQDKIKKLTSHSKDGTISRRDKAKLLFEKAKIGAFQSQLNSYKSTLAIALEFSTFKTASDNFKATQELEQKIEDTTALLTGQMQGLQIGLQAVLDAGSQNNELVQDDSQDQLAEIRQSQILGAIEQQNVALNHCYRACMAAFKETTKATGHEYKYVKASNQARLLMGDLGNVEGGAQHSFTNLEVTGGWVVAGNMEGASAKDFFK